MPILVNSETEQLLMLFERAVAGELYSSKFHFRIVEISYSLDKILLIVKFRFLGAIQFP